MKFENRYEGLIFSREQIDELQRMLKLRRHHEALQVAGMIQGILMSLENFQEERRRLPDNATVKKHLKQVSLRCRQAADLLATTPFSEILAAEEPPGANDWRKSNLDRLQYVIRLLYVISSHAQSCAADKRVLRSKPIITDVLWPLLFGIWEQCGNRVAATENGPTQRFLSLVHTAVKLAEPDANTLKDAVREWRQAGSHPHNLPLRHGGS